MHVRLGIRWIGAISYGKLVISQPQGAYQTKVKIGLRYGNKVINLCIYPRHAYTETAYALQGMTYSCKP